MFLQIMSYLMQITYYIFVLNILFPGKLFYLKPNVGGFRNDKTLTCFLEFYTCTYYVPKSWGLSWLSFSIFIAARVINGQSSYCFSMHCWRLHTSRNTYLGTRFNRIFLKSVLTISKIKGSMLIPEILKVITLPILFFRFILEDSIGFPRNIYLFLEGPWNFERKLYLAKYVMWNIHLALNMVLIPYSIRIRN